MNDKLNPKVKMPVGQYAGTPVDELPMSYCRWIIGQDFPDEVMEAAKRKVGSSPLTVGTLNVTRHAVDRFSMRFIQQWHDYNSIQGSGRLGMATFLARLAEESWEKGDAVSKNRHKDDGIVKQHEGIKFVFSQSKKYPEYKELITVM